MAGTELIKSGCPHCGKAIGVRTDQIGRRLRCPACRLSFVIESPSQQIESPPPTPAPEPNPEEQSPTPKEIIWSAAEDANELVRSPSPLPQGPKAKITASFRRSRPLVFQAILQVLRDSRYDIITIDQANCHVKFSFSDSAGKSSSHLLFIFESVDGTAEMDISSQISDDTNYFDSYYHSIIHEVAKYLRFAPESESGQSAQRSSPPVNTNRDEDHSDRPRSRRRHYFRRRPQGQGSRLVFFLLLGTLLGGIAAAGFGFVFGTVSVGGSAYKVGNQYYDENGNRINPGGTALAGACCFAPFGALVGATLGAGISYLASSRDRTR